MKTGDGTELALIATVVVLYAGGWIAAEFALRTIEPLSLAATRFLIAGAILVTVARVTHRPLGFDRPFTLFGLAFFGIALGHAVLYWGLRIAPATDGAIINTALAPIISLAAAVAFLGERISRRGVAGAALGILGVLLVIVGPREQAGPEVLLGDALMALGATSIAVYTVLGRVAMINGSAIGVAGSSTLLAGAMMLPFALLTEAPFTPATWSFETWLAYGYMTIPSAVVASAVYYALVRRSGAVRATIVQYIVPVVVFGLSAWLFSEALTPLRVGGALLAIVGTRLVLADQRTGIAPPTEV
ncbi:MAG: EamA family transporter [Chloroflexi bacterium]|nr:EamA family transporter [Chloroflexota bacterium]